MTKDAQLALGIREKIANFKGAMTAHQLGEILNISKQTIFRMARNGQLPCFRVGNLVRFDPKAISEWPTLSGAGHLYGRGRLESTNMPNTMSTQVTIPAERKLLVSRKEAAQLLSAR